MARSPETISIPSNLEGVVSEEIGISRVIGDIATPISFELTGTESYIDSLRRGPEVRRVLKNGGRVFITEADDLLLIKPGSKPQRS